MPSREFYQLTAQNFPDLVNQLNFLLARLQDRFDKIEGVRGVSTIEDGLQIETDGEVVHGFNTEDEV